MTYNMKWFYEQLNELSNEWLDDLLNELKERLIYELEDEITQMNN